MGGRYSGRRFVQQGGALLSEDHHGRRIEARALLAAHEHDRNRRGHWYWPVRGIWCHHLPSWTGWSSGCLLRYGAYGLLAYAVSRRDELLSPGARRIRNLCHQIRLAFLWLRIGVELLVQLGHHGRC